MEEKDKFILLTRIQEPHVAHIVRSAIESYDIPCYLLDEHSHSTLPYMQTGLGGVRVMVSEKDYTEAQKILAEYQNKKEPEEKPLLPKTKKGKLGFSTSILTFWLTGAPLPLKDKNEDND